jgi:hypothetical protein
MPSVRCLLLLLLFFLPGTLAFAAFPDADELRRRATPPAAREGSHIPLVEGGLELDGVLDEPFWQEALVWRLAYETAGGANRPAPVETYVLMAATRQALRVGFVNLDPNPRQIRATFADRDRWDWTADDAVGLYVDTFGDERNAYYLMVNARGVQFDAMRLDRGGQGLHDDASFDLLWHSASRIGELGYVVEIEVPFRYLRLGADGRDTTSWNLMPFRVYPRDFRYQMTAFPWDFNRNCFLCQLPTVSLATPDTSFRPLQAIPYVSGIAERTGTLRDHQAGAGVDMKYQAAAWALDATFLPDFSQVETDAFLLTTNIRFLPRLPERRPFFMERADLFRFPLSQIIYTRTMLDPTVGVRGTGKQGPHNWAALTLRDRATWLLFPGLERSAVEVLDQLPSQNSLFRYRYDRSADAVMGVFVSDREYEGGFNRLLSLDGQFALGSRHTFVAQFVGSRTEYPADVAARFGAREGTFGGTGYILRLARPGRNFAYQVETRDYGDGLVTGLGFLQRVGVRQFNASPSYTFWPASPTVRSVTTFLNFNSEWDRSTLDPLNVSTQAGLTLSGARQTGMAAHVQREHERLLGVPFDLNQVVVAVGSTPWPAYQIEASMVRGHAIDVRLIERMQEARLQLAQTFFLWDRRLRLMHQVDRFRLFQAHPAQSAQIQRVQAELQLTPGLSLRTVAQRLDFRWRDPRYPAFVPDRQRQFANQTVLRYRLNYASAFYFGWYTNQTRIDDGRDTGWNVFTKFSFLL